MHSLEFCYWLQGFFEINTSVENLDKDQIGVIKSHLQLVFKNETANKNNESSGLNGTCGTAGLLTD